MMNQLLVSLDAPDYLYKLWPKIRKSENCDEVLRDRSLNEKHDCNDVINSINVHCVNDMQNPKLGDANFAMSTTCCNDHDWVILLMISKIYLSLMMNMKLIIMFEITLKVGLKESQL